MQTALRKLCETDGFVSALQLHEVEPENLHLRLRGTLQLGPDTPLLASGSTLRLSKATRLQLIAMLTYFPFATHANKVLLEAAQRAGIEIPRTSASLLAASVKKRRGAFDPEGSRSESEKKQAREDK